MKHSHLKAFTYEGIGGNSAGVVLLEDQVSDFQMQKKAAEVGFSETVFVKRIDDNKFEIRFFTPECEVDLCGHGTIAAFYYLALKGIIKPKDKKWTGSQTTKAGSLNVEVTFNKDEIEKVCMQQAQPKDYGEMNSLSDLADSLNISEESIGLINYNIKPRIISTGLKDLLVPIKSRRILNDINPDFKKIKEISKENQVTGYHLYTIENNTIYTRNFAPLVGIDEESATGTASGALIYLLARENITEEVDIIQGESMGQSSLIYAKALKINSKYIIKVGGKASLIDEY